jgi:hypothetical protein
VLLVLLVITALVVFAIAAATVGSVVARLSGEASPAVFQIDAAVEWIAERLPFEIAAEISHDDVDRILRWHLDYFGDVGLATEFGEELGGDAVASGDDPVVAEADESVDYVVGRALAEGRGVTALQVVCVLDLQLQYLAHIGAIERSGERTGRPGSPENGV